MGVVRLDELPGPHVKSAFDTEHIVPLHVFPAIRATAAFLALVSADFVQQATQVGLWTILGRIDG